MRGTPWTGMRREAGNYEWLRPVITGGGLCLGAQFTAKARLFAIVVPPW
jgi:hypothetical protein